VTRRSRYRAAVLPFAFAVVFGLSGAKSPAALDMSVGARKVVNDQPVSACNSAAKSALNSVLQDAQELGGEGSGEWQGYGAADASAGGSTASAAIHCYPVGGGYVVTFTCAAQVPPYSDSAAALCTKLAAAFDAKAP
jgi:hypothetical protein